MQAPPILHAAQGMTQSDAFEVWVLPALLVLVSAALTIVLLAARELLRRPSSRHRAIIGLAAAMTALAMLPSLLPYDHLLTDAAHAAEHGAVHASHCHDAPASCADAPLTAGPGQLFGADRLIVVPATLAMVLLAAVTLPLLGITRRPDLRPPLGTMASR